MKCENPECRETEARLRAKIREIYGAYGEIHRAWEAVLDRIGRIAKTKDYLALQIEHEWQMSRHLEEIKRLEKESDERRKKLRVANRKIKALKGIPHG